MKLKFGKSVIGTKKSFLIAEIGSNHNQSLKIAKESIEVAKECGADAVKFQSINLKELYKNPSITTQKLHNIIDLDESWHQHLSNHCKKNKINFLSTPTYLKAITILSKINVKAYKIASAQAAIFPQLIEQVARKNKLTFISTGLSTFKEIHEVIKIFKKVKNNKFVIMYCNSEYPPNPKLVNIKRVLDLKKKFKCEVGFSDHTKSSVASIAAIGLGAIVIEKHFKINDNIKSPDSHFSLNPYEFNKFSSDIREFELINNYKPRNKLENQERIFRNKINHYMVATKDIINGQIINNTNSKLLRSGYINNSFIDANYAYNNKKITCKSLIKKDQWIKKNQIK